MLKTRLIPVLLLKNGILVRSRNFTFHQLIGNHIEQAKRFSEWKADEIIYLDITRDNVYEFEKIKNVIGSTSSKSEVAINSRKNMIEIVQDVSKICRVPLTIGGKIKSLDDIRLRLKAGADKVVLNTAAIENPLLIKQAASEFGSQCIVVCLDLKSKNKNEWMLLKNFGKDKSDLEVVSWIQKVQELGAGEILLQSVDRDGTGKGYDLNLLKSVSKHIHVPFIILGGAGKFDDFVKANKVNREVSLGAANIFHFTEQSILNAKKFLSKSKMNVRTF
tara:strand:+ start:400 stop:1227 length:828 start_codon:yes stop_codon:yes gene_type:complete